MNVADKDLCRELYEFSGWEDTPRHWAGGDDWHVADSGIWPAYDLGYLLRKLPCPNLYQTKGGDWVAEAYKQNPTKLVKIDDALADTPADAACKLAIELFKSGVLEGEQ